MTTKIRKCQAVGGVSACKASDCPEKLDRAAAVSSATEKLNSPSSSFEERVEARKSLSKLNSETPKVAPAQKSEPKPKKAKRLLLNQDNYNAPKVIRENRVELEKKPGRMYTPPSKLFSGRGIPDEVESKEFDIYVNDERVGVMSGVIEPQSTRHKGTRLRKDLAPKVIWRAYGKDGLHDSGSNRTSVVAYMTEKFLESKKDAQ